MHDTLRTLLQSVEYDSRPTFCFDQTEFWPDGHVQALIVAGVFVPLGPLRSLVCRSCGEAPCQDLVPITHGNAEFVYLPCARCGLSRVPPERLQQWSLHLPALFDWALHDLGVLGQRDEVVPQRVWRLGKTRWDGATWNVFFARGLRQPDAWGVVDRLQARSVLLVPTPIPGLDLQRPRHTTVIDDLLSWDGCRFKFDHEQMVVRLRDVATASKRPVKPRPRRSSRSTAIERLTQEMHEHLRSARDYAVTTRDRSGVPELLPRPNQQDLARRLGLSEVSVHRCLHDPRARQLRLLWDLALDAGAILRYAGR